MLLRALACVSLASVVACTGTGSPDGNDDETVTSASAELQGLGVQSLATTSVGPLHEVRLLNASGDEVAAFEFDTNDPRRSAIHASWRHVAYDVEGGESDVTVQRDHIAVATLAAGSSGGEATWSGADDQKVQVNELLHVVGLVGHELSVPGPWNPQKPAIDWNRRVQPQSCTTDHSSCQTVCRETYGGLWGWITGNLAACNTGCDTAKFICDHPYGYIIRVGNQD